MTPQEFKQKRKELNLTQKQFAKELGLQNDRHIRYIESGQRELKGVLLKCFEYYCEINQPKQQGEWIFYLVEYKSYENYIDNRWLFRTKKQAKDHIKKELYLSYDRSYCHWRSQEDSNMYAEIITLIV